ncbi:MAG: cytochrome b [Rhizobiaceae bacterium]
MTGKAANGYSRISIIAHWLAAIAVIALFFTLEGDRDSLSVAFHISGGALIGIFLIWRVSRRVMRGFPAKPVQHPLLNLASQIVLWSLLLSILVVTLSGYQLPWSIGRPIDISGHVIIPLVLLHIAGALKYWLWDRDGVMQRMMPGTEGGA